MKKLLILAALAALCMPAVRAQQTPAAPLRVIFDTDMGNDVDDPLALDMLYKAVDRGEITPARHSQQQGYRVLAPLYRYDEYVVRLSRNSGREGP